MSKIIVGEKVGKYNPSRVLVLTVFSELYDDAPLIEDSVELKDGEEFHGEKLDFIKEVVGNYDKDFILGLAFPEYLEDWRDDVLNTLFGNEEKSFEFLELRYFDENGSEFHVDIK